MTSPPTSPRWNNDEELLADLDEALAEAPPTTSELVDAGVAAFAWRTVDEDLALAALVYDSIMDTQLTARVRSRGGARTLVFRTPELAVEVEVTTEGIVGQLDPVPPSRARISGQGRAGTFDQAYADELGCFVLRAPPPGPVRLRCRSGAGGLVTDWVCLTDS